MRQRRRRMRAQRRRRVIGMDRRCGDHRHRRQREDVLGETGVATGRGAIAAAVAVGAAVVRGLGGIGGGGGVGRRVMRHAGVVVFQGRVVTRMRTARLRPHDFGRRRASHPHPRHRRTHPVRDEGEAEQGVEERTGEAHGGSLRAPGQRRGCPGGMTPPKRDWERDAG